MIFDHNGAEVRCQIAADDACGHVRRTAGAKWHHKLDRVLGEGLGRGRRHDGRNNCRKCCHYSQSVDELSPSLPYCHASLPRPLSFIIVVPAWRAPSTHRPALHPLCTALRVRKFLLAARIRKILGQIGAGSVVRGTVCRGCDSVRKSLSAIAAAGEGSR